MKPLRILVVDDSHQNTEHLSSLIHRSGVGVVVGTARDGAEALARVHEVAPDVITLDLEMPRMDGFGFLRLVMSSRPTPVLVVSSYSRKENVFRALELGALDFVAKPASGSDDEFDRMLLQKLELVRSVSQSRLSRLPVGVASDAPPPLMRPRRQPRVVVAIGSSTGGPTALTDVLSRLPQTSDYAVLVAQHMPAKFTRTFAQRLNRYSAFSVAEATQGEPLQVGQVIVCPGNSCMEVVREDSREVQIKLSPPNPDERYIPNATRLFSSVAALYGRNAIAVVLTGMGDDGAVGAALVAAAGGQVLVESEATAVVYGMPRATRHLVPSCHSAPLNRIADEIQRLVGAVIPTSRP